MQIAHLFSLLFAFLCISCDTEVNSSPTPPSVAAKALEATRQKVADYATHSYRYVSLWDNHFANSTYADSMHVKYTRLPDGAYGFAYLATGPDYDVLYDGKDHLHIDHQKRKVIRTTAEEIAKDSAFFDHKMYFGATPRGLPRMEEYDRITDTLIDGRSLWAYRISAQSPSVNPADGDITNTHTYFIDGGEALLVRLRKVSHRGKDTLQVINYHLDQYAFDPEPYRFSENDRSSTLGYRELTVAADNREKLVGLVKAGDQLDRADYSDVTGRERLLFGETGHKSVVMFGFIGCGGCEYALREMKKQDYRIKDGINFYYSSPVDADKKLDPYLTHKQFPHPRFGKESRMNDQFRVAAFPTFVFIDKQGVVERVMGGYDPEVEGLLIGNTRAPWINGPEGS